MRYRGGLGRGARAELASAFAALGAGIMVTLAAIVPSGFRLSILVRMASHDPIARVASAADPHWAWATQHYDGIYFFAIGIDPLATGRAHGLIDQAAYRYGHPAYGWLSGVLAAFQPAWMPASMLLVNLVAIFIAGFLAARLATLVGLSGWLGLSIAINPGILLAVTDATSEALGAALLLAVLCAWITRRYRLAALLAIPMCFTKEPLLLVPFAIAGWELVEHWRGRRAPSMVRRLAPLAAGPALYIGWWVYVHAQLHTWSVTSGGLLSLPIPLLGWARTVHHAGVWAMTGDLLQVQIGSALLVILVGTLGLMAIGMLAAARLRTPAAAAYLGIALVMCFLSWWQLLYPKDLVRSVAFILVLLPAAFGPGMHLPSASRTGLAPEVDGAAGA